MLTNAYRDVQLFHFSVLGDDHLRDPEPSPLRGRQHDEGVEVLREEVQEFADAASLTDQVDALLDLTYFALGRLHQMGLTPEQVARCWTEIQRANLSKVPGVTKRGHLNDAAKPEGWQPPALSRALFGRGAG